jgi:hypothetical protein
MNAPIDHVSQARPGIQPFPDRLYVVTAISNPCRYRARYNLYRAFEKHCADGGAILYTVEMAFGGRPFEITDACNPRHVQVRGDNELWHKENLLNIGISRLPAEAKYIAWIDADIEFARPDWAQETLHQLQHYAMVQMFSHSVDLGPDAQPVDSAISWMESLRKGLAFQGTKSVAAGAVSAGSGPISGAVELHGKTGWPRGSWHSGLAWAARRSALDAVGGLIDFAILGSADRNMAAGLFGFMQDTIDPSFSREYRRWLLDWQDRAERHVRRNVGQVDGTVMHYWHGQKTNRKYTERWKILSKYQFNPRTDIKRDAQSLWQLEDHHDLRSIGLRDALRGYFRQRNEDSIDV